LVGLFSPRRTTYDVHAQDAQVRQIPGDYYGGPAAQSLHVTEDAAGSTVTGLRVDVGGIRPFVAEGYTSVPPVESDLRLAASAGDLRVLGTLTTKGPLKEAVLIAGGQQQRLGDLEPGHEVTIDIQVTGSATLSYYDYPSQLTEQILGPGDYWNDRNLYRRYQFLQAILANEGPGTTSFGGTWLTPGLYLVGWGEENVPLPVEVVERPFSTVATTLYVYDLPVAGLETGATVTIPPGLITRQVEEMTGVDVWPENMHMGPEAEIVFRFTVWPGVAVQQVDELYLNMRGTSYGNTSYSPTVSLWNQESNKWDVLDVGWGSHSIPNAGAYVLPSGAVLLRLETGAEWEADVERLTITIKGQR